MRAKRKKISNWRELVTWFGKLDEVGLACRGESQVYKTMWPKIDRIVRFTSLRRQLRIESALVQRFREHAPIYLTNVEHGYLQSRWLSLMVMQHYGAPTRLLDWTKSPWVAAYFAVSENFESDARIFAFRRKKLEEKAKDIIKGKLVYGAHIDSPDERWDIASANDVLFSDTEAKDLQRAVATYYCRQAHFPRIVAQQSLFTFATRPKIDHWGYIRKHLAESDRWEVCIKASAKRRVLRMLNHIGLNGATLFPGADGIGRELTGFARCWPMNPMPPQFME